MDTSNTTANATGNGSDAAHESMNMIPHALLSALSPLVLVCTMPASHSGSEATSLLAPAPEYTSSAPPAMSAATPGLLAIRVGRAETIANGPIEHAVILIENGKIVTIGEDLPIERGIPVIDRPLWVVMPGLVDAYSRLGLDSEGGEELAPDAHASAELYPNAEEYKDELKHGITTLGLYPAGNGIPGQAVAIKPVGKTAEEMTLRDSAYLKIILRAAPNSKKLIQDGFKKADDFAEKEKKAKEKWDKEQEKKKKSSSKKEEKSDEKKGEEKKEETKPDESKSKEDAKESSSEGFVPPEPDAKTKPFVDLRDGKLHALVSIAGAAEYLHLLDALGKEKIDFDLRIPVIRELDIFYVETKKAYDLDVDGIGDRKCRVVMEPVLSYFPGTMRQRNLQAELSLAGAKLVLIPRSDSQYDHKSWLVHTGELVNAGLDRQTALRAMTLEPAELLGVEKRVGSLEKGKDANLLFLNGDPFQPSTQIQAVMIEGQVVYGEANL
jgi:hypothetical protein